MSDLAIVQRLMALGLRGKQLAGVIEILADREREDQDRQRKDDERKERERERSRLRRGQPADKPRSDRGQTTVATVVNSGQVSPKETPPAPPKEITPSTSLRSDNKPRTRASRIPENFQPDLAAAYGEGLSPQEAASEAANFRDYWTARPTNATKLDWPATWRVWCRKAAKDLGGNFRPAAPTNGRRSTGLDALMSAAADLDQDLARQPELQNGQLKLIGK